MRSTQQSIDQTNNKSNGLLAISVIALLFLIGALVLVVQIRNKENFIGPVYEESIDCTDFDPCTTDLKLIVRDHHHNHDRDRNRDLEKFISPGLSIYLFFLFL